MSNGPDRTLDLESHLEEIRGFQKQQVHDRVSAWYSGNEETREKETGWENPPHKFVSERAAKLIRYSLEIGDGPTVLGQYPPKTQTRDIIFLTGVETLLTAIAMKEDTEWFLSVSKPGRTPTFGGIIQEKVPEWVSGLSGEQQDRIITILQILKEHRNNLVHFGLHQMRHSPDYPAYYDVIAYLFVEYFENRDEVVRDLREVADLQQQTHPGIDYQWILFDFE